MKNSTVKTKIIEYKYIFQFDKLFDLMSEEWEMKNDRNQACILDEFTKQGNKFAEIYKNVLLSALLLFLLLPLFPSFLDIVFPLNETRQQLQIFKMKYFVNEDEYFYPIYFHSVWGSFVIIMITVTIDSLYILIIHHASGLFAMCGYQIAKATECNNIDINENELFRQCVITHNKAYKFFEIMNKSSRNSYFLQLLLTIIGISITAVQIVMYLHKPEEAFRISLFLIAAQFHLFIITLTGQVIADQSSNLANNIYCTTWYRMPPNIQKIFHMIQIKSSKPCKLTAGGILELNIENFGIVRNNV
ncbi:uncharacterized protein LOC133666970 [Apis cerana]|uniref:uncharacterized protein LOC133666970 n=1 Tax=Apis cerana TaxID=7461 RepID=UPI002B2344A2|nr:uncharacterized protein LOC133666970 [Apis cerana]